MEEQTTTMVHPSYLPIVAAEVVDNQTIGDDSTTPSPFIEANSIPITLESLMTDCVIPNFAKDNEAVLSHSQFIYRGNISSYT